MTDSRIILFLRGEANALSNRNIPYYSLDQMLSFSFRTIEDSHDIIQWMFPLPEPSKFNPFAPLLTQDDIETIKLDGYIKSRILLSVEKMLKFYGFEIAEESWFSNIEDRDLIFKKSSQFKFRAPEWIKQRDHNHLRITRILRCLHLIGYDKIAQSFFKLLEEIYQQYKPIIDFTTCEYWRMGCGLKPWEPGKR